MMLYFGAATLVIPGIHVSSIQRPWSDVNRFAPVIWGGHRRIVSFMTASKCGSVARTSASVTSQVASSLQISSACSGYLASVPYANQTGSSSVTRRVFRSAPAPQDAIDETERERREGSTDLPATMAVTVLPLSRFNRSLKLLKAFDCVNSLMNHNAMSISSTSAYKGDQSLCR